MSTFFAEYGTLLLKGTLETLYMSLASTFFAYIIGLPLGILLYTTDRGGIFENRAVNKVLGAVVNIGRSIPFIILLVAVSPLTRLISGKIIGPTAAIVPLVIGAAPFVARLCETSFIELDPGVIEAAKCMGCTGIQIVYEVIISESVPSIIRGISITVITLIGYSAMAGAVGAGGLGDIAIRFGLHRGEKDIMWVTVVLLIVLVFIIQGLFSFGANLIDKQK